MNRCLIQVPMVSVSNKTEKLSKALWLRGSPLDWVEHQFLDADEALIQCAVHDARFIIDSGECISGPCYGESLQSLPIVVQDDGIYLQAS